MNFLVDPVKEQMGELEVLMAIVEDPAIKIVELFPDILEIKDNLIDISAHNHIFRINDIIRRFLNINKIKEEYSYKTIGDAVPYFNIEIVLDEGSDSIKLESINNKYVLKGGKIFLIKNRIKDDSESLKRLGDNRILSYYSYSKDYKLIEGYKDRIKDVFDILDCKERNGYRKQLMDIEAKYNKIMKDNLWNIRSVSLSNRIATYIREYIDSNNKNALCNLLKVKLMTYNNEPIYSIEEETMNSRYYYE